MDTEREKIEEQLKKSLVKLKIAKKTIDSMRESLSEPIAIIGMGCRFPGNVSTPEEFWDLLKEGKDAVIEIPTSRWDIDEYYDFDKEAPGKMYTKSGGFLQQPIDHFDNEFFNVSPREAQDMDPQQRLLLEVCYEALEDAGIPSDMLKGSDTGMYMGIMYNDYFRLLDQTVNNQEITAYYDSGNLFSATIGRLSYYFGIHGPCIPIDTACSSSLVAIELACESLRSKKSQLALAGGVNLTLKPESMVMECKANMLSRDGRCKTFDASADGFSHSEGCGVVVLKRLSDAQKDNDRILAVIRGGAVNHGGASSGLTVPSQLAEEGLMRLALQNASLNPNDIDYIEAHGTGTSLGDPIEVAGIASVYGKDRNPENPLFLGSVKTNIGHTESAAGVAGLMKVVLALQHKTIPAHLHLHQLNPLLEIKNIPAKITTQTIPWEKESSPRRAGISSFGFSGINAHIIIEEAPLTEAKITLQEERPLHILTLSAKTEPALKALFESYLDFLDRTDEKLSDICYTANTGRNHERYRIAVIAQDVPELKTKLNASEFLQGEVEQTTAYEFMAKGDWAKDLNELAIAYTKGAVVDWEKFDKPFARKKVSLPTYPFQRKPYWAEAAVPTLGKKLASVHPLLGEKYSTPDNEIVYRGELNLGILPYLKDHQVYKDIIFPGAGYLEMMLASGLNAIGEGEIHLSQVSIEAALSFNSRKSVETQILMKPIEMGYEVAIYSQAQGVSGENASWNCHARGTVGVRDDSEALPPLNIEQIRNRCETLLNRKTFYEHVNSSGIYYGEQFQSLEKIYVGQKEALGELKLAASSKSYLAHPAILDGALQLLAVSLSEESSKDLYLPVGCDTMKFYASLGDEVLAYWQETEKTEMGRSGNLTFCIKSGKILAKLTGIHYRKTTEHALKQVLAHESSVDEWLYEWSWEEMFLKEPGIPHPLGHWLILNDGKVPDTWVNVFESKGASIRRISGADHPKTKEAFIELLKSENFNGILHLASANDLMPLTAGAISNAQNLSTKSLLHLAQALVELEKTVKIPLFLITRKLLNNSPTSLLSAPLLGLYKTILIEHPELKMKLIDMENEPNINLVFRAFFSVTSESIFSMRQNQCYVPRLLKAKRVYKPENKMTLDEKIRSDATYLITGGVGGLGLTLARWLIGKGAGHLVLTGRRILDDELKSTLKSLVTDEARITYESIDIGDEKSVSNLLSRLELNEKPLKGIFHLAGVLDDAILMEQDWTHFEKVFHPKVYGSYYLHHYSKDLDFFVMFSSIASTIGSLGQSNYAAANAFMDALCGYRQQLGLPAHSLSWGPWAEVGMAKTLVSRHTKGGMLGLNPNEGMRALELALLFPQAHLMIAKMNWKNYLAQLLDPPTWLAAFIEKAISRDNLPARLDIIPPSERFDAVKSYVMDVVREVLGIPHSHVLDEKKGFFDMGLDSLMAIELKNRLQMGIGKTVILASTTVFDYASIEKMTQYVADLLKIDSIKIKKQELPMMPVRSDEPIAIIGMGCRYPGGANNPEEFWRVLEMGIDGISEVPKERFDINAYYDPAYDIPGKMYTRCGGFLNVPVDLFDAEFFGISPKEAEDMDPQQRLLLEVTWEAIENASVPPETLEGSSTGLYVGMMYSDYSQLIMTSKGVEGISAYYGSGNAFSAAVGRVSYCFGFQGPCMAIDTACSSSLVAINSACESLRLGECQQAIAGGVSLMLAPGSFISACQAHMLSPDGHCKTFDQSADGYARAEGCGMIMLKRLSDAKRDGNKIYALIRSSGVNQGGATSGLTVPNGKAQEALLRHVYKEVGLKPDDIDYVEAHGTGTSLGDPIEVRAIGAAYGSRDPSRPLLLGSAKSNIGHTESAAGVAGVIKMILSLNHEMLPPNLNFKELNPHIELNFPAKILTEKMPWPKGDRIRRAGVSSFGFSGVNAHVILEEAPPIEFKAAEDEERPLHILTLSARTEPALEALIKTYQSFLDKTDFNLSDICYTANTGRNHERFRIAVIAQDVPELKARLTASEFRQGEALQTTAYEFTSTGDWAKDLNELAMAYTKGAVIDWEKLDAPFVRQKISLPTYPFQRKRYWAEAAVPTFGKKLASVHPLLGEKYSTPDNEIIYRCELHLGALPYLKDHQVYGHIIYPGAGYLEMMLAASLNGIGEGEIHLSQVSIEAALSFDAGKVVEIQTVMKPAEGGYKVAVYSQEQEANSENAAWHCHARGTVSINENLNILADFNIDNVRSRCEKIIDHKDFYEAVNSIGIYYGEEFQAVNRLYLGKGEVLAELKIPALTKKYLAHPTLLDGGLQLLAASLWQEKSKDLYLPVGCEAMDFYAPLGDQVLAHWQETEKLEMGRTSNITFYTPLGKILAKITGMHYRKTTEPALKQMLSHESRVDEWLYEWSWEEKFLEEPNIPDPLGHWLVLNDGKVSDTLVNLFESKGASIRQISSADHPKTKEDFIALLKSENFNGILHVTSMGNIIPATSTSIGIAEAQELGCKSFLHLTQALIQLEETLKIPTFLITEGIYSENLAQSPLSGLYKTILLEHPELQMNAIDVSDDFDSPSLFRLIFSSNSESICSLRKSACYVPRFLKLKNIRVEGEEFMPREKIRPEVTYLITGGLGGLGLALTKWLSEHEVTHIVLTGRRALSEEMSKTLNNLKTKSTEITYKALDIADEKSVENLLVSLEQSEKPLKGIFHLAGILDDATLMDQDWNRFENVFRPKVYGSYYLHHYSKDLDFFVMFSSIASTLGSLGQSNYAAANAFMDALCEYRHLKGMPAKSISWGPWAEVGMAKELTSRHAISGLHALKPVEGIRALERALFAKPVHITIANIHWSDFLKQMIKPPLYLEHFEDVKAVRFDLALELKALPEDSRLNLVQKYVADALCTIMRLPPSQEIDKDKGFFDMGLDSLMAVEFKNKLQAGLGSVIRLPSTIVFDYSSIAKMTTYLAEKLVIQVVQKEAVSAKEREEKKILDEIEKLSQEEAIEKLKRELGDD